MFFEVSLFRIVELFFFVVTIWRLTKYYIGSRRQIHPENQKILSANVTASRAECQKTDPVAH
ncbi:MAG: hypothetical protein MJ189_00415, partial [Coriobacteriales bacterium]|nr:hypothetical protein [Coriobacteriales bacterium]